MADRNMKHRFKGFTSNPLVKQGSKAIAQCLAPVMDFAELLKVTVNKFNDKGRPDHIREWSEIECIITPNGTTSKNSSKDGDRSTTKYNVLFLAPLKLQIGDVLRHKEFGVMKIFEFDGFAPMGLTSANAIKLNAGWDITDGDMIRVKQVEIN